MKQFSLEKYLENPNRKVITRDGHAVRIICTDRKFKYLNVQHPVMALIKDFDDDNEYTFNFTSDGLEQWGNNNIDLFFAPIKKEGWVNMYYKTRSEGVQISQIYSSKEEAEMSRNDASYISTAKIEWEE